MNEKTYTLVCHGCGRLHERRAFFLSTPMGFSHAGWSFGCNGCPECMEAGKGKPRSESPIARAWDHGISVEARARAVAEIEAWVAARARTSEAVTT